MGGSAGAPSALQMAIRHPDRVAAMVLLVPLTYKPPSLADSAPPMAPGLEGQSASPQERARVEAMLENILPVSLRGEGLRSDTAVGKHLAPSPLNSLRIPTLVISARDDRYGTFASTQYTANHIAGAKFIGFDLGGHTWVGHDDEVRAAIVELLLPSAKP